MEDWKQATKQGKALPSQVVALLVFNDLNSASQPQPKAKAKSKTLNTA
jgi:hypothetical protein